jgi:hypothetical protein
MEKNDKDRFAMLMARLALSFERSDLSPEKILDYFMELSDLGIDQLEQAVRKIKRTRRVPYFPLIADVRDACFQTDEETMLDEAVAGYGLLNRLGSMAKGRNPILDETVVMCWGSWENWGEGDPKNNSYEWPRFLACWKAVARKRRKALELTGGEVKQLDK